MLSLNSATNFEQLNKYSLIFPCTPIMKLPVEYERRHGK